MQIHTSDKMWKILLALLVLSTALVSLCIGDTMIAEAHVPVNASPDVIAQWFRDLDEHPERYVFESHLNLELISGNWGEVSSVIQTTEDFGLQPVVLQFTFIAVDDHSFSLHLIDYPVIIHFSMHSSILTIRVVGSGWGKILVLVNSQIERQLSREIDHIKQSVETILNK